MALATRDETSALWERARRLRAGLLVCPDCPRRWEVEGGDKDKDRDRDTKVKFK